MAGPPDAEGADAHQHVRLELLDLPPQPLHQPIDVVPPPGGAIREAAGRHRAGMAVGVGEGHLAAFLLDRVRVEVVVDVDAIHVVPADHVADDLDEAVGGHRLTGIEPEKLPVAPHGVWHRDAGVRRSHGPGSIGMADAVGIEPAMEFEPAGVRLRDGEGERVVGRVRRLAHGAAEIVRPGLERRVVEGVGAGPHLEDHGIEPRVGRTIEQRGKFGPLSVRR